MAEIVPFNKNKEKEKEFHVKVVYKDGEEQNIVCSFFGASLDIPGYMVFLESVGDEDFPNALVNSELVKRMEVVTVEKEVEQNNDED